MPNHVFSKPSSYICPDCGRAYKAAETMNRHRKNHSDFCHYACSICTASFKRKDLLDRHMQIHIGKRPTSTRNRSPRACDRCFKLKTRCDNASPCSNCTKRGHNCTYTHLRSRNRADRSSISSSVASSNSSEYSSPNSQAIDVDILAHETSVPPELEFDTFQNPAWTETTWADAFWTKETPCEWSGNAEFNPDLQLLDINLNRTYSYPGPSLVQEPVNAPFTLDTALEESILDHQHHPTLEISDSNGGNDDPTANRTWYQKDPAQSQDDYIFNASTGPLPNQLYESKPTEPYPTATPDSTQHQITQELAHLTTSPSTNLTPEIWPSLSQKTTEAFNLNLDPTNPSNIFPHFHTHFTTFFHPTWPQINTLLPPHLYLTTAAIGAAYCGPKAEVFHHKMLAALRLKLLLLPTSSSEDVLSMIQSLSLIQAATLHFGDWSALETVPGTAAALVELCRGVGLFDAGHTQNFGSGVVDERRRRLAVEVSKLDVHVALLFGGCPLLSEEERRA